MKLLFIKLKNIILFFFKYSKYILLILRLLNFSKIFFNINFFDMILIDNNDNNNDNDNDIKKKKQWFFLIYSLTIIRYSFYSWISIKLIEEGYGPEAAESFFNYLLLMDKTIINFFDELLKEEEIKEVDELLNSLKENNQIEEIEEETSS